tara:strand:+ start:645 stop:884 length:240 start_codon:yes stop_codon:yes gene_type:complete
MSTEETTDQEQAKLLAQLRAFFFWLEKDKDVMLCELADYQVFGPQGEMKAWQPARLSVHAAWEEFCSLMAKKETPDDGG